MTGESLLPRERMETDADWHERILCMITPDSLRRHLARAILGRFADAGFEPAGWRLQMVSSAQIDRMSERQGVAASDVYRYRALDALFSLGPALLVVLADQRPRSADERYALIKEMKGNADPYCAAPGTIRHDLGSINVVLSLLHTSDSPEQSMAEWEIFTAGADSKPSTAQDDVDAIVAMLEATQPREARGFPEVITAVRGRLLSSLWPSLSAEGRRLATQLAAEGSLATAETGALLAKHLHIANGMEEFVDLLRTPFDGGGPRLDLGAFQRILAAHGLEMDSWELAVLTTSSYFMPAR
jgi:nucleoside diphosphate kinase